MTASHERVTSEPSTAVSRELYACRPITPVGPPGPADRPTSWNGAWRLHSGADDGPPPLVASAPCAGRASSATQALEQRRASRRSPGGNVTSDSPSLTGRGRSASHTAQANFIADQLVGLRWNSASRRRPGAIAVRLGTGRSAFAILGSALVDRAMARRIEGWWGGEGGQELPRLSGGYWTISPILGDQFF